jgi:hypothetical protein
MEKQMKRDESIRGGIDRRNFIRTMGSGSAVAAVAAAAPIVSATDAKAYDPGAEQRKARYRADSDDVKAFYRTNGYETLKK